MVMENPNRAGDCPRGQQPSLLRRSVVYVPPPGFNPVTASPEDLARYHIVPRPDPKLHPEQFENWLRIFAPPIDFVDPRIEEVAMDWQINLNLPKPSQAAAASVSRFDASRNWSGAYIVPTDDTMCVLVAGTWTIPTVSLPPVEHQVPGAKQYVCSTWVGLDGQRLYLNSSLPQVGTMQTLTLAPPASPQASAIAFFQWWDRETGGTFLQFTGLPVNPGDRMTGAVWAETPTLAISYLRDMSTGQMAIVGATSPVIPFVGPLTISGATAEWILERPTEFGKTTPYPFPAYNRTTFACWAGLARAAGPPEFWRHLRRARFIRLFDTMYNPTRTKFISMPTRQLDARVRLDYGDFKD